LARIVAGALAFHLDNVGAEIGKRLPCPRARQDTSEFKDTDALQRLGHGSGSPGDNKFQGRRAL
jgi:hypothetical protein